MTTREMKNALVFVVSAIVIQTQLPNALAQNSAHRASNSSLKLIPAGKYIRGRHRSIEKIFSHDHTYNRWLELQPHMVRITKPFYIASTEVTVGQFNQFIKATGYKTTAEKGEVHGRGFKYGESNYGPDHIDPFETAEQYNWKNPGFEQTDDHPVVCVSWHDAQEYCKWLSEKDGVTYRLPTEAEWEHACRAETKSAFYWGNDYRGLIHQKVNLANVELEKAYKDLGVRHWFIDIENGEGDGHVFTAPVGSFPANQNQLHDMHGNVWEWCQDTYVETTYRQYRSNGQTLAHKLAVDPISTEKWNEFGQWQVIRGGSWYNNPATCRSDVREYYDGNESACYLGFRIARDASEEECAESIKRWELEQEATRKVLATVKNFERAGPGGVERRLVFRETPDPEVTRDLHLISFITNIDASRVEPESVAHLAKVPGLKELRINHLDNLTDEDLKPIGQLKSLESVILPWGRSKLTNDLVAELTNLTNLTTLELNGEAITDEGLVKLSELKKLKELRLAGTGTKGGILTSLGAVPLTSLALGDLADEHAARLSDLKELRGFTCRGQSLTGEGFSHFADLRQLTSLSVRGCTGIDEKDFTPLQSLTALTNLDLVATNAGDEAMRFLAPLSELSYLQVGEAVSDEGLIRICDVISLNTINISSPKITDAGLRDMWRMQRLTTLRLDHHEAKITGEGFAPLTEAKQLGTLTVRSKAFTDKGMEYLSMMPQLRSLTIGNWHGGSPELTDKGLLMLLELEKLRYLSIGIKNTQITDEALEKLKQANPDLRLEVSR